MVNTILLILLVIVNYTNFYLTHIHGKRRTNPNMKKKFLR
jgi:hypothetical protein